ncbi:MAG: hypothetical protein PVH41_11320 [Anaerolineae bacterium]
MTTASHSKASATYEIQILGRLGQDWSDWLDGMAMTFERGVTTLTGPVADQAALRGILTRLWDVNLTLISVRRVETGHPRRETSDSA